MREEGLTDPMSLDRKEVNRRETNSMTTGRRKILMMMKAPIQTKALYLLCMTLVNRTCIQTRIRRLIIPAPYLMTSRKRIFGVQGHQMRFRLVCISLTKKN